MNHVIIAAIIGGLLGGLGWQTIGLYYWRDRALKAEQNSGGEGAER